GSNKVGFDAVHWAIGFLLASTGDLGSSVMLEEICFRFPNGPSLGAFLPLGWTFPRVATLDQGKSMATLSLVLLSFGVPNRILANIGWPMVSTMMQERAPLKATKAYLTMNANKDK